MTVTSARASMARTAAQSPRIAVIIRRMWRILLSFRARRRGNFMLDTFAADLRYALRIFRRSPGFAATAVVSLAVGIAAATALFSIVNAALLNPFPFADVDRIVRIDTIDEGTPRGLGITARQLVALQQSDVFDGVFVSKIGRAHV